MRSTRNERMRWSAGVVWIAIATAGCGAGDRAGAGWHAVRDTIGDTVVVRTVTGSVWDGPRRLAEELRIGMVEGAEEYLFGAITALAVDGDGGIYVFDYQVPALRKYAPDGSYVATFGRDGGGPGEYRKPDGGALAVLRDGRVLLRDPDNARINVYSPDGTPLGSWPIAGGRFVSMPLVVDTAGYVYTQVFGNVRGMARYSPNGEPLDTIPAPKWELDTPTITAAREGSRMTWAVPFSPVRRWAFSPFGYMVGGITSRYAIDVFRPEGGVLRLERTVEPVPVSAGEKAAEERRVSAAMRRLQPDWRWNGPAIPDVKPFFDDVLVARDGRIWVRVTRPGIEVESNGDDPANAEPPSFVEPVVFDVFEPDGTYLGQLHAPAGFALDPDPVFRDDQVWAIVKDEFEVQYLTRFRVERVSGARAGTE